MCLSVCVCACLAVYTITQKIIELSQPNLVCNKNLGWDCEQNRPTVVASALTAQFVFLESA